MKRCPRCSSEISQTDKVCPRCGLPVSQMQDIEKKFNLQSESEETEEVVIPSKREEKRKRKEEKKQAKQAKKQAKKQHLDSDEIDFSQFAVNSGVPDPDEILDTDTYSERRKKRKRLQAKPRFMIDENGEFDINTSDVEIVGEETGKIIDKQFEQSYSIKKSRGDYIPPKLKWWEIYKFADRHFARSKIKKEVNKAAKIRPSFVKKSKLLLLAIFLGWVGAHNFYAKNKRKGWVSVIALIVTTLVTMLTPYSSFFASIQVSIGGFAGFVVLFIWLSDIINIIFNQFKYKFQRDRFIAGLNVETRAKLGRKYIDMDLYHKPWWVRFKVWLGRVKRNHQERQRERRQRLIEKEKRKQAEIEEKSKIENDIAKFEEDENQDLKKKGKLENSENADKAEIEREIKEIVDESTIEELKTFDDGTVSNGDDESNSSEDMQNQEQSEEDSLSTPNASSRSAYRKKYEKTIKNKKAEKKKKKK